MARILVVDDEEDIREALTEILEDEGHDVFEAENGLEVMAMAVSARIDLILLDMAMPEMTGFAVMERLNNDPQTSSIPVIVVTGLGRPEHLDNARSLGTIDYINKPWADDEVQMRVGWAHNGKRNETVASSSDIVNPRGAELNWRTPVYGDRCSPRCRASTLTRSMGVLRFGIISSARTGQAFGLRNRRHLDPGKEPWHVS